MNEKNNPEVQEELNTVQIAAQKLVNDLAGDNSVKIVALEVGNNTIERWYNSSSKRITSEKLIDVEGNGKAFEVKGVKWKSCVTAEKEVGYESFICCIKMIFFLVIREITWEQEKEKIKLI